MAGGTFYSQNKIRPGAYINFKKEEEKIESNGTRGIVAVCLDLDWGADGEIIELTPADMSNGTSLEKVGFMASDESAKIVNAILANASLAKIYRLNKGGAKANTTSGNLTVTAKCNGTFGNKIAILITSVGTNVFEVKTFADGYLVDTQRVGTIDGLEDNAFVEFSGTGALAAISTSKLLTGGTNGVTTPTTVYAEFFELLKNVRFNVLPVCNNRTTINPLIPNFVKTMRDDEGKYIQAVVSNYDEANSEGIINNVCGAVINNVTYSPEEFTAYVAGMTAGASATESNTGKVITGATSIVGALAHSEIEAALKLGKFVLSANQDGGIKVEKDINSLHDYSEDLDYNFTKNRVIRILDEIGSSIQNIWENTYLGKVSNNEVGRAMFKSSIITYLQSLQNIGAIRDFAGADDVEVQAGDTIDAVVADLRVKPVDAMEFLYLTVNVAQ